jgi:hypothetical protein
MYGTNFQIRKISKAYVDTINNALWTEQDA